MKKIIFAAGLCLVLSMSAQAAGEMKEVCHDKTDKSGKIITGKDGKPVQVCKTIKVHKKLEGTKIPEKK